MFAGSANSAPRPRVSPKFPPLVLPARAQTSKASEIYYLMESWALARVGKPLAWRAASERGPCSGKRASTEFIFRGRVLLPSHFVKSGELTFAEPNHRLVRAAFPADPYTPYQWWLRAVVDPALTPPLVRFTSPTLAIIEADAIDLGHPNFGTHDRQRPAPERSTRNRGSRHCFSCCQRPRHSWHLAGHEHPGSSRTRRKMCRCGRSHPSGGRSWKASVINMSYVISGGCFAHYLARQGMMARGQRWSPQRETSTWKAIPPMPTPATDPHVITVGALNPDILPQRNSVTPT